MTYMEKYALTKLLSQAGSKIQAGDAWTRAQMQALSQSDFGQLAGRMGKGAWGSVKDLGGYVGKHPLQSAIGTAGTVGASDLVSRLLFNRSVFGGEDKLYPEIGYLEDTGLNPHNLRKQEEEQPWYRHGQ